MSDPKEQLARALGPGYEVRSLIGQGGFGDVYAAWDVRLKRDVAVKVVRSDLLVSRTLLERFQREAEAAARLRHPNIVPIYAVGEHEGLVWFTMPLVRGESLQTVLEQGGPLPVAEAVRVLRESAAALAVAHADGIVHRDIKPDNIMLEGPERRVLLMDFGIAKAMAAEEPSLTGSGFIVGTPQYMSPEQASGERSLDHRSDIYALGIVAYQILAGRLPFEGATPQSVIVQHLTSDPTPIAQLRADVPEHVAAAVMRCLAKRPEERWATAHQFIAALDPGGVAAQTTVPFTPQKMAARRPRRAIATAAALAATLAVLAWAARGRLAAWTAPPPTVAVLFFDNPSRDSNDTYLAEGLTDELAARLGTVERLQVKSLNAVRRVQQSGAGSDFAALAGALDVTYLVEGSVRRSGQRVRVTVSLVKAADGFRVWGAQFDRSTMDILGLQTEIAGQVARNIAGRLLPAEQSRLALRPTQNPAAYDHFLRANHYLRQRGQRALELAIAEYDSAVTLDPGFTAALARVSLSYALALWWSWPVEGYTPEMLLARGLAATDAILARDSTVGDAWTARGNLLTFKHPRTYEGVEDAFTRALAADPDNAETWHQYGWVLSTTGRDSASHAAYTRAIALDPDRPVSWSALSWHYYYILRRYEDARAAADSALALDSTAYYVYPLRLLYRLELSDTAGALRDADAAQRLGPSGYNLQGAYAGAIEALIRGNRAAARAAVDRMLRNLTTPGHASFNEAFYIGNAQLRLGDRDGALRLLEGITPRGAGLWLTLRFPMFDPIRNEPRFRELVAVSRPPSVRE